ncbi:hypothetical protein PF005_g32524 [Phytophthora fragariae]|uniref:Uncharacterized protein n=1 Tax=Phytophthora fragariae TaxID=53985 RepID=A0A6A3DF09_9STRA|nr:hypothetical protein PF009_g32571 [Phytophthora fragariae]KAE9158249.1 hypothetical protein PF005_g32524 [Phytophthora fragariae]
MSSSSFDTPAPSSPTVAATDPATGIHVPAPIATPTAGSPMPSTVEAATTASAASFPMVGFRQPDAVTALHAPRSSFLPSTRYR